MKILAIEMFLDLPFASSLKDKRAIRQSLMAKLKRDFSISVRETALQDSIQHLKLSAAFICLSDSEGEEYIQRIQAFVETFALNKSCLLWHLSWDIVDVWRD